MLMRLTRKWCVPVAIVEQPYGVGARVKRDHSAELRDAPAFNHGLILDDPVAIVGHVERHRLLHFLHHHSVPVTQILAQVQFRKWTVIGRRGRRGRTLGQVLPSVERWATWWPERPSIPQATRYSHVLRRWSVGQRRQFTFRPECGCFLFHGRPCKNPIETLQNGKFDSLKRNNWVIKLAWLDRPHNCLI